MGWLFSFLKKTLKPYASRKHISRFYTCNICGWQGNKFVDDSWHKSSRCPNCWSSVRHRLLIASLEYSHELKRKVSLNGKKVMHFAPEKYLSGYISSIADQYVTVDFLRKDCDLRLDMCDMDTINDESYDVILALDVLEHVPDFTQALKELHRCLVTNEGVAILTVPQVERLTTTFEDPSITTREQRFKFYGQWDHVRLFGEDFKDRVTEVGFTVHEISSKSFSDITAIRHMLLHTIPSLDENATNNRRIYFCFKN